MKLIDLLVQELPKIYGWNNLWAAVSYDVINGVRVHANMPTKDKVFGWQDPKGVDSYQIDILPNRLDIEDECVTRKQYEAAISASKKPVWCGYGLPPIGSEVEFFNEDYGIRDSVPKNGTVVKIVSHDRTSAGFDVAVFTWPGDKGGLHAEVCTEMLLRPIRTEAERKRQVAVDQMAMYCTPGEIYDAIASGQITGVKLESS